MACMCEALHTRGQKVVLLLSFRANKNTPTLLSLLRSKDFFGRQFNRNSWRAWHIFLKSLFALPLTTSELSTYQQCTGRTAPPKQPAREGWLVVGHRGGKSLIAALVAVYLAAFKNYDQILAPGEKGTILILAADRQQARVVFRFVVGLLESVPALAEMVVNKVQKSIELDNGVVLKFRGGFRAN